MPVTGVANVLDPQIDQSWADEAQEDIGERGGGKTHGGSAEAELPGGVDEARAAHGGNELRPIPSGWAPTIPGVIWSVPRGPKQTVPDLVPCWRLGIVRAPLTAPQLWCPHTMMCLTFRAVTAYSRQDMAFMSLWVTRLPTLRCTKTSPGPRPISWLAWWVVVGVPSGGPRLVARGCSHWAGEGGFKHVPAPSAASI